MEKNKMSVAGASLMIAFFITILLVGGIGLLVAGKIFWGIMALVTPVTIITISAIVLYKENKDYKKFKRYNPDKDIPC
jgi:polyferredoxin